MKGGRALAVIQPGHAHKPKQRVPPYQRLKAGGCTQLIYIAEYDKTVEQKAAEAVAGALNVGLAIRIIPAENVWPMPTGGSSDDAPGTVQERVASLKKHLTKPDPVGDVGKVHPLGDVGKVTCASELLKVKEPDD